MKTGKTKKLLIVAVSAAVACVLQLIGLILYLGRLLGDRVGIGLYSVTIIAFALVAFGFFIQWKKAKGEE